jgi:hypothetical protein
MADFHTRYFIYLGKKDTAFLKMSRHVRYPIKCNAFHNLFVSGSYNIHVPVPVAERSKARICSRSIAGTACLNPSGGMDVCLF